MFIDFFDIILFSGPFLVFGGMGQSKDSGKLTFKGLTSSDSTVNIVEDASSMTFSSNSSGTPIDQYEIVYGTGTGIKSSIFCVDIRSGYESITGAGVISPKLNNNLNVLSSGCNNIIIGGESNLMTVNGELKATSKNNVILGGYANTNLGATISKFGDYNSIISGDSNSITNSNSSVIVSGISNVLEKTAMNSSIISSKSSCLDQSSNSSIISSDKVCIKNNSSEISIFSSYKVNIRPSKYSTALSSYNSILSGCGNILISVSDSSFGTNSRHSSIFSSTSSQISNSYYSTIVSGYKNCIIGENLGTSFSRIFDSNIFAGTCNCLSGSVIVAGKTHTLCSATIFAGTKNKICSCPKTPLDSQDVSFAGSVILSGAKNTIQSSTVSNLSNSPVNGLVIGGGVGNIIDYSYNNSIITNGASNYLAAGDSAILSSQLSSICTSKNTYSSRNIIISSEESCIYQSIETFKVYNSAIVSSYKSRIAYSGKNNTVISTNCSFISDNIASKSTFDTDNNIIIGGKCGRLQAKNSSILGGYRNCIYDGGDPNPIYNSTIVSGECNSLYRGYNNSIIGGFKGRIFAGSYNSSIIGGSNSVISASNSVIIGANGLTNSWSNSAMFGSIIISNKLYHQGITGFSGLWTPSAFTLCARGGIITIY